MTLFAGPRGFYGCYCLHSLNPKWLNKSKSYIGFTNNPARRIRQHNGEIQGGAKKTKKDDKRPWEMILFVGGFANNIAALKFEYMWTYPAKSRYVFKLNKDPVVRFGSFKAASDSYKKQTLINNAKSRGTTSKDEISNNKEALNETENDDEEIKTKFIHPQLAPIKETYGKISNPNSVKRVLEVLQLLLRNPPWCLQPLFVVVVSHNYADLVGKLRIPPHMPQIFCDICNAEFEIIKKKIASDIYRMNINVDKTASTTLMTNSTVSAFTEEATIHNNIGQTGAANRPQKIVDTETGKQIANTNDEFDTIKRKLEPPSSVFLRQNYHFNDKAEINRIKSVFIDKCPYCNQEIDLLYHRWMYPCLFCTKYRAHLYCVARNSVIGTSSLIPVIVKCVNNNCKRTSLWADLLRKKTQYLYEERRFIKNELIQYYNKVMEKTDNRRKKKRLLFDATNKQDPTANFQSQNVVTQYNTDEASIGDHNANFTLESSSSYNHETLEEYENPNVSDNSEYVKFKYIHNFIVKKIMKMYQRLVNEDDTYNCETIDNSNQISTKEGACEYSNNVTTNKEMLKTIFNEVDESQESGSTDELEDSELYSDDTASCNSDSDSYNDEENIEIEKSESCETDHKQNNEEDILKANNCGKFLEDTDSISSGSTS